MLINDMNCGIKQVKDMSLRECANHILKRHGLDTRYDVTIDEGLPQDQKLILFRPQEGTVAEILTQLADTYGGVLHVIDTPYQQSINFRQNNYY